MAGVLWVGAGGGGGNSSRSGSGGRQARGRGGHYAQTTLPCFLLAGPGRLLFWETPVSPQPVPRHRYIRGPGSERAFLQAPALGEPR